MDVCAEIGLYRMTCLGDHRRPPLMNRDDLANTIFIIIVLLVVGGLGIRLIGKGDVALGRQLVAQVAATRFPNTTGTITQSSLSKLPGYKDTRYNWGLAYDYEVNRQTWHGRTYRYNKTSPTLFMSSASPRGLQAQQLAARYPVGAAVPVFYNPGNPQDSVLAPGLNGEELILILMSIPFNLVGVGVLFLIIATMRDLFPPSKAGGVPIIRNGFRLRARLRTGGNAVTLGILVAIGAGLPAATVVGAPFSRNPPVWLAAAALALVLGGSLVTALLPGAYDLVIDTAMREVELPPTR